MRSACRPKTAAFATLVRSRKASRYRTERTGMTFRSILVKSLRVEIPSGGIAAAYPSLFASAYAAAGCARSGSYLGWPWRPLLSL